ncbi:hypothetical protein [Trichocoleus desertorum]
MHSETFVSSYCYAAYWRSLALTSTTGRDKILSGELFTRKTLL